MRSDAERFLSPPWARALCLAGLSLVLAIAFYWPAIWSYPATQVEDGVFFQQQVLAAKVSLGRYHELPLWNPYRCGGVPLWDNPQSIVAAPLMLLALPLNIAATMRLWYIAHHAAAFVGMWLFARHDVRLSRMASFVAAAVFAFNVALANHLAGGHAAFVSFGYVPLALFLWRRAERDAGCAVGVGLLLALMIYEGAAYPLPYVILILAAETLTRLWPPRRIGRILASGVVAGGVFVCVGAARALPVVDQLRRHKRALAPEAESLSWSAIYDMFLSQTHDLHGWNVGFDWVWGEYIAYLGPLLVGLAFFGLVFTRRRELGLAALGLLVFLLMCGHFAPWAPWHVLRGHVFPYKSMRVPSRFRLVLMAFIATWIGIAVDRAPALARRLGLRLGAAARSAMVALALLGAGEAIGYASMIVAPRFTGPPVSKAPPSARLFLDDATLAPFVERPLQNRGPTVCIDPWRDNEWYFSDGAALWSGDVPQARADGPGAQVSNVVRTPNTFRFDADVTERGRVLLNVPYEVGWRTSVGSTVDHDKVLEVVLPAGHQHVRVWYWPVGLTAGLWTTAVALALVIAYFADGVLDLRRRVRRLRQSGQDRAAQGARFGRRSPES
jgi:hypothetical protein